MTRVAGIRLAILALLLALVVVAAVAWVGKHDAVSSARRRESAHIDATQAARGALPAFGNLSAATLVADETRGRSVLTPQYAAKYDQQFSTLAATAQSHKETLIESVTDAAPETVSADAIQVRVLVFFTERATFGDGTPAQSRPLQEELTMQNVSGHWLVSDVVAVA